MSHAILLKIVVCGLLTAVAMPCSAGETSYDCEVHTASQLSAEGTLSKHWSVESWIGQKFTVDRETGRIIGGPLDNARMTIDLIDRGSDEMSFQVFARSSQRTHTTLLKIEEFQRQELKPFEGTTTLWYPGIYTGTCK